MSIREAMLKATGDRALVHGARLGVLHLDHHLTCARVGVGDRLRVVVNRARLPEAGDRGVDQARVECAQRYGLGIPVKLSVTPGSIRRPAPLLGQHTDEILAEIKGSDPFRLG